MNWRLVASLVPAGAVIGVASVLGILRTAWEPVAWVAVGIAWVFFVAREADEKPFLHGFLVGAFGGFLAPLVQAIFMDTYLDRNPDVAALLATTSVPPVVATLVSGVVIAFVFGLVVGFTARMLVEQRARREAAKR